MTTSDRSILVFLSYAHEDKPIINELFERLSKEDWIIPWLDERSLLAGQNWPDVIEESVEKSDAVIVFLSNQSVNKNGFVQREVRYAYTISLEKPEDAIFLIPVRIEDCQVPRSLKSLHWIDYFGESIDDTYKKLLLALNQRRTQVIELESMERARREQEESLRLEAEEKAWREKVELARKEGEEKARLELERARLAEEEKAREELARKKAEQKTRREARLRAQKEAEEHESLKQENFAHRQSPRILDVAHDGPANKNREEKNTGVSQDNSKVLTAKKRSREIQLTPKVYKFPWSIKIPSMKHIWGWIIRVVGALVLISLDVALSWLVYQKNEWWIYLLLVGWILTSLVIIFIGWEYIDMEFSDGYKPIKFAEESGNDIIILTGNRKLSALDTSTGRMVVLRKGIKQDINRFVALPKLNQVILETGEMIDIATNLPLGRFDGESGKVIASGKEKNLVVTSNSKEIIVFDCTTRTVIGRFLHLAPLSGEVIVSNNEDLVIYNSKDFRVRIWSISLQKEIDDINADLVGSDLLTLKINAMDDMLALAGKSRLVLYSIPEKRICLKFSSDDEILSSIFIPDTPYLMLSMNDFTQLFLNVKTGEYSVVKSRIYEYLDKLFYIPSSKEIIGIPRYEYRYLVWKADDFLNMVENKQKLQLN